MKVLHKKNKGKSMRKEGAYRCEVRLNLGQKNEDFKRAFK